MREWETIQHHLANVIKNRLHSHLLFFGIVFSLDSFQDPFTLPGLLVSILSCAFYHCFSSLSFIPKQIILPLPKPIHPEVFRTLHCTCSQSEFFSLNLNFCTVFKHKLHFSRKKVIIALNRLFGR